MYAKHVAIASLWFSLCTAGCHRGGFSNAPAGAQGAVGLVVQNQNFYDMDVYVVSEGLATRVGDVTGNSTALHARSLVLPLQRAARHRDACRRQWPRLEWIAERGA